VVDEEQIETIEIVRSKLLNYPSPFLETAALAHIYPQGDERRLILEVLGKEVPRGMRPTDIGILVINVGTLIAIHEAVRFRKPLYERVMTVSGECVVHPQNLLVRIGTTFQEVIAQCGGFLRTPGKVIMGGPMMGTALSDLEVPVIKTTQAIVALAPEITRLEPIEPCIRCGYCVTACPVHLNPSTLTLAAERDRFDLAFEFGVLDCVECGNCSYVCPSKRPMVEILQYAKASVRKQFGLHGAERIAAGAAA
jgi:electron transport complex protein RnfC